MRRTAVWMLILLAGAGWFAWGEWRALWERRHQVVADAMQARFAQIAPDWRLEFASVELLDDARVRIKELRIGHKDRRESLVFVPDMLVHLHRDLLADGLQVLATRVELHQPVVRLVRDSAGQWNWQGWPRLTGQGVPTPEMHCTDGVIQVRVAAGDVLPETQFDLTELDVVGINTAFHQYQLRGTSAVDTAGALEFDGTLNLDTLAWSLNGRCPELQSPDSLLQLAASLSPDARERLQSLALQCPAGHAVENGSIHAVSHADPAAPEQPRCAWPALGVSARMELAFQLRSAARGEPLQYQCGARIQDGVIRNAALPLPLHDLNGELFVDNSRLVLKSLRASNGDSRLFIDGEVQRDGPAPARKFTLQAQNLQFGREIEAHLWGCLRTLYDTLRPAGRFNVDVVAETDADGRTRVQLNTFEAFDCSVLPAAFPYPTHGIQGRITQEQDRFLVDFTGFAGQQPFTARGEVRNTGVALETDVQVQVRGVPIDDMLREACSTPALAPARQALDKLRLTGTADVDARIVRRGTEAPARVGIDARLRDGTALCEQFPYLVTDVSGRLQHDPFAADPGLQHIWQFTELRGKHGPAEITAEGGFAVKGPHALLDLHIDSLGTPIDRELELACLAASPPLRELFDSIGRAGTVDLRDMRLLWSPPGKPVVSLPNITVRDAMVRLKYWPFPWERVQAQLAWDSQRLTIAQLNGWYGGETYLEIDNGGDPAAATLDVLPQGELGWQLHLEDVRIRRLIPDAVLRRSLIPSGVDAIVEELDPRGPLDLDLGLDVKGYRDPAQLVTASWRMDARLDNNTIAAGVELSQVTGLVKIVRGAWDGYRSFVDGYFELETASALGVPFTAVSGPFLFDGEDAYVGTPTWPEARTAPPYDRTLNKYAVRGEQPGDVQADVYGGKVGLNVQARLAPRDPEQTTYRAAITVRDARLEAWAGAAADSDRLRGPINGQMDFVGQGTSDRALRGQGWVQISPAQLYELPVLNRVLASFDLRQPDRTAFTYAYGEFQLHDGVFDFSLIDLVGESLRLVGRGTVAYAAGLDGRLAIDFFRSKFRNQIPVFGQIFSAVTTNSIGVRVGGTIDNPVVNVQPKLGIVDDTLRKLLDAFNAGAMPTAPRNGPPLGPATLRNQPPR